MRQALVVLFFYLDGIDVFLSDESHIANESEWKNGKIKMYKKQPKSKYNFYICNEIILNYQCTVRFLLSQCTVRFLRSKASSSLIHCHRVKLKDFQVNFENYMKETFQDYYEKDE